MGTALHRSAATTEFKSSRQLPHSIKPLTYRTGRRIPHSHHTTTSPHIIRQYRPAWHRQIVRHLHAIELLRHRRKAKLRVAADEPKRLHNRPNGQDDIVAVRTDLRHQRVLPAVRHAGVVEYLLFGEQRLAGIVAQVERLQ